MKGYKSYVLAVMVLFSLTLVATGIGQAQNIPDLSIWLNTWFKLTLTATVYHYSDIGVKPFPNYQIPIPLPVYLNITGWNQGGGVLTANLFTKDLTGNWNPAVVAPIDLTYFAGDALKFVCTGSATVGSKQFGFIVYFKGKRDAAGNFILGGMTFLKTLGGYYFEVADIPPGSTDRYAGAVLIQGNMVPLSKVPLPIQ
jgi:hypothetical protein